MTPNKRKSWPDRLDKIVEANRTDEFNHLYVYALQTPIMLLTFSVMTFLAGRPLARNLAWNDDTKARAP